MNYSVEHSASLITFDGEGASERLRHLLDVVRNMGGRAVVLAGAGAEWLGLTAPELERQRLLDTPLRDPVSAIRRTNQTTLMLDRLAMRGVSTVRDALVLGTQALGGRAGGLTESRLELIVRATATVYPHQALLAEPTAADIAKLCVGLNQVHAGVLPAYYRHLSGQLHGHAWARVGDVLDDNPRLHQLLGTDDLAACRLQAMRFAAEFLEARQALASQQQSQD